MPYDNSPDNYFGAGMDSYGNLVKEETSMLDDLLATDSKLEQDASNFQSPKLSGSEALKLGNAIHQKVEDELNTVAVQDGDFTPLDLRHLSHTDFSVVVAGVMRRLGTSDMTFTQEELSGLEAPEGQVSVLACTYSPSTGAVRFRILTGPKSEFRS